ncbi:redoxin domain-containing protein [bacterium]|nr:redoxin domain-containing protein [bacterium]MBT3795606.1 redoxin domain-containing protein [bacterium]
MLFIVFSFSVSSAEHDSSSKGLVNLDKRFIPINKEIILSQEMTIIDGDKNSEIIILDNLDGLNIVNFWASWCNPCIEEISELNKFQENIYSKNLNVSLIGINIFDKKKDAISFYVKYKPFFKTIFDNKNTISVKFSVMGVPETYFVKDNKILFKYMGKINQEILERGIDESSKY